MKKFILGFIFASACLLAVSNQPPPNFYAAPFPSDVLGNGAYIRKTALDSAIATITTDSISFLLGRNNSWTGTNAFTQTLTTAAINASGPVAIGGTLSSGDLLTVVDNQAAPVQMRVRNNSSSASAYAMVGVNASGNSWGMRMGSSAANSNALEWVVDAFGTPAIRLTLATDGTLTTVGDAVIPTGKLLRTNTINNADNSANMLLRSGTSTYVGNSNPAVITDAGAMSVSSITTAAPSGGTAGVWKTGIKVTGASVVDATQYIQLEVGGVLYKLVVAQ